MARNETFQSPRENPSQGSRWLGEPVPSSPQGRALGKGFSDTTSHSILPLWFLRKQDLGPSLSTDHLCLRPCSALTVSNTPSKLVPVSCPYPKSSAGSAPPWQEATAAQVQPPPPARPAPCCSRFRPNSNGVALMVFVKRGLLSLINRIPHVQVSKPFHSVFLTPGKAAPEGDCWPCVPDGADAHGGSRGARPRSR